MQDQEKRRRRYRSTLRNAQADATRQRVVAAAGRCFAIRGFTATTLGAIADEAGVSVETVQAHGPKRMLLLAAVETASAGVDGGRSILDVPEARAVLEQTSNAEAVAAAPNTGPTPWLASPAVRRLRAPSALGTRQASS